MRSTDGKLKAAASLFTLQIEQAESRSEEWASLLDYPSHFQ
jgi:hypothetical protein